MSVQVMYSWFLAYPGQLINALALFFASTGSWLLLATRVRQQQAMAALAVDAEPRGVGAGVSMSDEPTARLNRFFNRFGALCLVMALTLSWGSTGL